MKGFNAVKNWSEAENLFQDAKELLSEAITN